MSFGDETELAERLECEFQEFSAKEVTILETEICDLVRSVRRNWAEEKVRV